MCHFLILSYATFGHCCKRIKTLRSVRSLSDPKQQGKNWSIYLGQQIFLTWKGRARAVGPGQSFHQRKASHSQFVGWSRSLLKREVESRKGEEPQSKKANPSENLDHFLLFLGLVFLCLTCCMSTTVSAIMEKKRNFSLNKHLRATAMKRPWEVGRWRRPACSALPWVANWEWLALRKGFVFLGEDEGQLSINLCKLRNEAVPSDSPRAFGLRRISWDVSSCVSFQPLQNGDSS